MAPNEDDSSDSDIGDYTTTNVLLGYASKEPADDSFSQLGGYPVSSLSFHSRRKCSRNLSNLTFPDMALPQLTPLSISRQMQKLQMSNDSIITAEWGLA